jgi:uncharacterized protein (TIGR03435 family)
MNSTRGAAIVALTVLVSASIVAQQAPSPNAPPSTPASQFEVVSIKQDPNSRPPVNAVEKLFLRASATGARNGRYALRATTLGTMIQAAYKVWDFQVLGAPSWVSSERFDVDARAPGAATFEQMRPMLQALLADRFQLVLRRETRQLPVYELMPVSNGLRIMPMKEGSCVPIEQAKPFEPLNICGGLRRKIVSPAPERRDVIEAAGVPMPTLVDFLSEETGRTVIDRTGFTGVFNFRLEFASSVDAGLVSVDTPVSGLSIFTAVEEQLGMRLRSTTGPVSVLVIERVERPSPN